MTPRPLMLTGLLLLTAAPLGLGADTTTTPASPANTTTVVLNKRYCEILFVSLVNGSFVADVFNTFRLNDCPEPQWSAITPENAKSDPNTLAVILNGPRYWRMDAFGPLASPIVKERVIKVVGGISMSLAGRVTIAKPSPAQPSYTLTMVTRNTDWIWRAGTMVYYLTNTTSGDTFIMQSNKANSTQDESVLESLGATFKYLPPSWTYTAARLSQDMNVTTPALVGGAATFGIVVQDEFQNTYSYTQDVTALAVRAGLLPSPSTTQPKPSGASATSVSVALLLCTLLLSAFLH